MRFQQLFLCTNNPGKEIEFRAVFPAHFTLITPNNAHVEIDPAETGGTLEENALLKAKSAYLFTGLTSIADDSGLEVMALNGAPGVHSARFAGEEKDDQANLAELLRRMEGMTDRRASFRTVIALIANEGTWTFEGKISGNITDRPRGNRGFGYDPIFVPDGYERTFAEMDPAAKNSISHRSIAIMKLVEWLDRKEMF